MAKTFHLAIPVTGDLNKTIEFYCKVLGCKKAIQKTTHFILGVILIFGAMN